jgi:hypothetical protein
MHVNDFQFLNKETTLGENKQCDFQAQYIMPKY